MQDARQGYIEIQDRAEPFPRKAMSLTAMPTRGQPCPRDLPPERPERREVPRYCVIVEVALRHRLQPGSGSGNPLISRGRCARRGCQPFRFVLLAALAFLMPHVGASWTLTSSLALQNVALSPNFATDNTLFIVTANKTVFESTNRGQRLHRSRCRVPSPRR
jgi:hypothetical protein